MSRELLEIGRTVLAASQQRLETVATNVANVSSPGFKRDVSFAAILQENTAVPTLETIPDLSRGAMRMSGNVFDLALAGEGYFLVAADDRMLLTRDGQFQRGAGGRLETTQGFAVQAADGGDVFVPGEQAEILADGTVLSDGVPVARIAVVSTERAALLQRVGGALFEAPDAAWTPLADPQVRQGMLEGSNVEMAPEMVEMMSAMRQAETASRIIQTYDSLIGQAITTFGQRAR
jgi:flagellar basal-body rod protein FlgF